MEILYPTLHNNDKAARIMMNCSIVSLATTQSRFDCQILTATFKPNSFKLIQVVIRTKKKRRELAIPSLEMPLLYNKTNHIFRAELAADDFWTVG